MDNILNQAKDAYAKNEDKVKEFAAQHDEQVDAAIDSVAQKAQQVAPDQAGDHIANAAEKAKDAFDQFHGGNNPAA